MNASQQLAKHLRDVYNGGNWTAVNLRTLLTSISWQQAITKVHSFNTIAELVFHIGYYSRPVLEVLKGNPLNASDKLSFLVPSIAAEADWQQLVERVFAEMELLAKAIEEVDEAVLYTDFSNDQYGSVYRNILGVIEHTHYHLGQIALIKKLVTQ